MFRQILGYFPANIIPAIVSFLMIYAYTRILTPTEFGEYTFAFSIVVFGQTFIYDPIQIAIMRLYPAAVAQRRKLPFLREASVVFYATALACILAFGTALLLIPHSTKESQFTCITLFILLLRALVTLNQAVNRSSNLMARFNYIECGHALLGFFLSLIFAAFLGANAMPVLFGYLCAALICVSFDPRSIATPCWTNWGPIDRFHMFRLVNFVWPLMLAGLTAALLQLSDRFVLASLGGTEMLGIYVAAYSLVERPVTLICVSVSSATFPMAVQALEQQGRQAGSVQAGKNGVALLTVCIPAAVGLAMISHYIAATLVGSAFRSGVAALIPIMCFTAAFRGVRSHFVDHAFHLAGKPKLLLWILAPAALANFLLSVALVQRFGVAGVAWSAFMCQAGATIAAWFIGQRLFPLTLAIGSIVRIVAAALAMAVILWGVSLPQNWYGLTGAMALGAAAFAVIGVLLDVGGIRSRLRTMAS